MIVHFFVNLIRKLQVRFVHKLCFLDNLMCNSWEEQEYLHLF